MILLRAPGSVSQRLDEGGETRWSVGQLAHGGIRLSTGRTVRNSVRTSSYEPTSQALGAIPPRRDPAPVRRYPEKETTVSTWKTIVVGIDGSPSSRTALTWAAAEAADHGADLVVLNVWEHTLLPPSGSVSVSERYVPDPSQRSADDLVNLIKEELGEDPPVAVQAHVKQGNPAKVLIEQSADANLLVVGTRGHGGFRGLVLGSVSQHVAAYAKCPVAVIR
jgi:nucleotide-binding universal stress UspA family protein